MRRKTTILGIAVVLLAVAGAGTLPAYHRVVSSVRSFQQNFGDLRQAESMNPVERFVFSLVLSHSKAPAEAASEYSSRISRT
ncbi:MAG: hypothetical protein ABI759_30030 [Candidatus Solibacter sp.]